METIPQKILRAIEKLALNNPYCGGLTLPEIAGITQDEYAKVIHGESICSKNERAFLDEIIEKYKLKTETTNGVKYVYLSNAPSLIYQSDFTKTNLSELVEGEG
ncbi:hypothetical protein [Leptospira phage LE4]|uniref:Uncharacterized protein n=1 Tax=Leptospira phage LE4 TaxID=2041383 RepID=A0A343LEA8_9CAUD|nr:hypothetical protein HWB34_gp05 [Leptospira phage LE4]ATN95018.1 hypothetical protein [Leptospira phage LE4]